MSSKESQSKPSLTIQKQLQLAEKLLSQRQQEITALEEQKSLLQNVVNKLDQRKRQQLSDIDEEVALKKQTAEEATAQLAAATQGNINLLQAQQQELLESVDSLTAQYTSLEEEVKFAQRDKIALGNEIAAQRSELTYIEDKNRDTVRENSRLQAQELERRQTISTLEAEVSSLEDGITALNAEAARIQEDTQELQKAMALKKDQLERELHAVHSNLQKAINQLSDTQAKDEATRRDLANRIVALEKREEVVKKREFLAQKAKTEYAEFNKFLKM